MYITILTYYDNKRSVCGCRFGRAEVVVYENSWKGTYTKASSGAGNTDNASVALGKALNKQEWLVNYMREHYNGEDSNVFDGRWFSEGGVGVSNLLYALGNAGIQSRVKDSSIVGRYWCLFELPDNIVNE